ncbi:MAG: ornithine carbamoyltransferase [Thermodesulfovibrionia bacterium]
MKRDFLRILDLSGNEIEAIIKRAVQMKSSRVISECPLIGKSIGLLFDKASTRTRISFQTGIYQLGAQAIYINANELQLGRGETIEDTARVLSRYLHAIVIRTYSHHIIETFAKESTIPVINGLTDLHHPCQALADLMTVFEKKGRLRGIKLAYVGDGNNVANSLIEASSLMGIEMRLACPKGYEPDEGIYKEAVSIGGDIKLFHIPDDAVRDADVIYTDVWVSMGQENESKKREMAFKDYQVNRRLVGLARPDAIVMHCLPAHRGKEITDDVIDSPQSVVFDQAENRLHTQKALLEMIVR